MGSLTGLASTLSPILALTTGIPGGILGAGTALASQAQARDQLRAQQSQALQQLQARQGMDEQTTAQNATLQKAQIAADAAAADVRRTSALRRAVAKQKTLFSAQGVGGNTDGSNEAVLLGLYNDAGDDAAADSQANALKTAALDQGLSQQKQKNLLEATQLAQNQSLARVLQDY